jgi:hypothetical protein
MKKEEKKEVKRQAGRQAGLEGNHALFVVQLTQNCFSLPPFFSSLSFFGRQLFFLHPLSHITHHITSTHIGTYNNNNNNNNSKLPWTN